MHGFIARTGCIGVGPLAVTWGLGYPVPLGPLFTPATGATISGTEYEPSDVGTEYELTMVGTAMPLRSDGMVPGHVVTTGVETEYTSGGCTPKPWT